VWEQLDSGRVTHRFEWVVLVATLLLIPVLIIEFETSSTPLERVRDGRQLGDLGDLRGRRPL
jgi:hypothetical protein